MVPVSGCFEEEGEEGEEGEGGEEEGGARSSPRRADIPRRARSLIVVPLLAAAGRECTGGRELGRPHVGRRFGVIAGVQCTRKSTVFTHYMKIWECVPLLESCVLEDVPSSSYLTDMYACS